jgi:hypothetical protein
VSKRRLSLLSGTLERLVAVSAATGAAAIVTAIAPAVANASCQSGATGAICNFAVSPSTTQAGSDATVAASISFSYGNTTDSVKNLSVTLPPGLFASLGAVPQTCTSAQLTMVPTGCPPGSQVGSGSLTTSLLPNTPLSVSLYLMAPPSATDAAGIGTVVTYKGVPLSTVTGVVDEAVVNGNPVLELNIPNLPHSLASVNFQVTQLSFTINGPAPSLLGPSFPSSNPFTRLPTSCATATSSIAVQTYASSSTNGTASSSFTPTGCSSLAFTPSMTATATRDSTDNGVTLVTTVTTNPAQAADKSLKLTVPSGTIAPDVFNAGHLFGQVVGTATAATPLVPAPLVGTVTLTGTISAPALTITFPPPFTLSFSGAVDPINNVVTFASVPDVPLNSLTLDLKGGPTALFYSTCAQPSGTIQAAFGGQNGAVENTNVPVTVTGCPQPALATLSRASATGLASGSAKVGFALAAGTGSPNLGSFTVSLPKGLSFNSKTYKKGLSVSGAKVKKATVSHGKLLVTLRSPVSSFTVKLSARALNVSKSLKKMIKAHKVKSLTAKVVATNTAGTTTSLTLALTV